MKVLKEQRNLANIKDRTHSADKTIRAEYVKMMQTGNYLVSYIAKMAKVSRQTLYNWQMDFAVTFFGPRLPSYQASYC